MLNWHFFLINFKLFKKKFFKNYFLTIKKKIEIDIFFIYFFYLNLKKKHEFELFINFI